MRTSFGQMEYKKFSFSEKFKFAGFCDITAHISSNNENCSSPTGRWVLRSKASQSPLTPVLKYRNCITAWFKKQF